MKVIFGKNNLILILKSKKMNLKNYINLKVDEIIIIHAKDNETVSFRNGKDFAKKIGAKFIALETGGYKLKDYYDLIAKLVKNGV